MGSDSADMVQRRRVHRNLVELQIVAGILLRASEELEVELTWKPVVLETWTVPVG